MTIIYDPEKHYFGKLCKHGHDYAKMGKSLRHLKGPRACVECASIQAKKCYAQKIEKNREKRREYEKSERGRTMAKAREIANPAAVKAKSARYVARHREEINARARKRCAENRSFVNERKRKYYQKNREKLTERRRLYYYTDEAKKQRLEYDKAHRAEINANARKRRAENKSLINEKERERYQKNRDKIREYQKQYLKLHPEKKAAWNAAAREKRKSQAKI